MAFSVAAHAAAGDLHQKPPGATPLHSASESIGPMDRLEPFDKRCGAGVWAQHGGSHSPPVSLLRGF